LIQINKYLTQKISVPKQNLKVYFMCCSRYKIFYA